MNKRSKKSKHKNSNVNPTLNHQNTSTTLTNQNQLFPTVKQKRPRRIRPILGIATLIVAILGLIVSYIGTISGDIQAQSSKEQTQIAKDTLEFTKQQATSTTQSNISNTPNTSNNDQSKLIDSNQTRYNLISSDILTSNLTISINNSSRDAFIIPVEQQPVFWNNKSDYLAAVYIDISNSSNIPITITGMDIMFSEPNVLISKTFIHANNLAITDSYSVNIDEYPNIFTLNPSENIHKYAIFITNYYPTNEMASAKLIIKTNQDKSFSCAFNIYKMPGLVIDPNKSPIQFDIKSSNKRDRISFFS